MEFRTACCIDDNEDRRTAMAGLALGIGLEVADRDGALSASPGSCVMFVHDREGAIPAAMADLTGSGTWQPVVGYATSPAVPRVVAALRAGVLDYFEWPVAPGAMADRLRALVSQADAIAATRADAARAATLMAKLSPRERQVVIGLVEGKQNKQIGRALGISHRTVEIHRTNMLGKLGTANSTEAILLALASGLISEWRETVRE